MRNKEGRLVPLNKRAEAIADYLEKNHRFNPPVTGTRRRINGRKVQNDPLKMRQVDPFTIEELIGMIKLTKKIKNRDQTM